VPLARKPSLGAFTGQSRSAPESEFTVKFPYQANAVLRQPAVPVEAPARRRVVVVEDQDDAREMLRILLETNGHFVEEASDGSAAVETIQREHPDVALVDIGLPGMTGYDVARKIRENRALADVFLVACNI